MACFVLLFANTCQGCREASGYGYEQIFNGVVIAVYTAYKMCLQIYCFYVKYKIGTLFIFLCFTLKKYDFSFIKNKIILKN